MAALILPLISNKNGAVYDSIVGVISRLLQSDVAKAGDPQRASEILVRVVKREHLPSHLYLGILQSSYGYASGIARLA
jgi:hypothetical protein